MSEPIAGMDGRTTVVGRVVRLGLDLVIVTMHRSVGVAMPVGVVIMMVIMIMIVIVGGLVLTARDLVVLTLVAVGLEQMVQADMEAGPELEAEHPQKAGPKRPAPAGRLTREVCLDERHVRDFGAVISAPPRGTQRRRSAPP